MSAVADMVGREVGGVVGVAATSTPGVFIWRCRCGAEFTRRGAAVRLAVKRSGTTSCGCALGAARAANGKANRTHGLSVGSERRLYDVWRQMHRRCADEDCADYSAYGRRGIRVTPAWQDASSFCAWAHASGYQPGLSLDRIDVDGPYSPDNCRWATAEQQASNLRKSRFLTHGGQTLTISQWARATGLHIQTIRTRLALGWDESRALSREPRA